jgi:hypothetical protein
MLDVLCDACHADAHDACQRGLCLCECREHPSTLAALTGVPDGIGPPTDT